MAWGKLRDPVASPHGAEDFHGGAGRFQGPHGILHLAMSGGVVLRDENGGIILSAWGNIPFCPSAEYAEAIAGLESVKCIIPYFAGAVHLENDCTYLIYELNGKALSKSAISGSVQDFKNTLECLPAWVVTKANRASNLITHELAKLGRNAESGYVLIGVVPPNVVKLPKNDCSPSYAS